MGWCCLRQEVGRSQPSASWRNYRVQYCLIFMLNTNVLTSDVYRRNMVISKETKRTLASCTWILVMTSIVYIFSQILCSWFDKIKQRPTRGNCSFVAHGYNWENYPEHLNIISKWNLLLFVWIKEWFNYFSRNMRIFLIKDFYQIELTWIIAVIFFWSRC